jgi:hypothetical protein
MSTGHAQSEELLALYRRAFAEYKSQALWNMRSFDDPTPDDALVVARRLRVDGDMPARFLAEEIERACGATH